MSAEPKLMPAEPGGPTLRKFEGGAGRILWWINALYGAYVVLSFSGILQAFHIFIHPLRYDALFLTYVLVMTFVYVPANRKAPRNRLPWYDVLAILLALAATLYIAVLAPEIPSRVHYSSSNLERALGLGAVVLVIEGARRTIGWIMAGLGIIFFIYPFISNHLPGFLYGVPLEFDRVIQFQYVFPYGLFGTLLHIFSTVAAPFMIFGAFLVRSGAGEWLIKMATALMGHFRGGPAKIAVVGSCMFGAISGDPTANLVTIGVFTIPLMKKTGYEPHYAAAVESASSEGSQIMPPMLGAIAFIMMDFIGVTYMEIVLAAIVPALLYYFALFVMMDLEAVKRGIKGMPREELPPRWATFKEGWPYLLPVATLLVLIGPLHYSPQTASVWSLMAVVVTSWLMKGKGMGPKRISNGLGEGVTTLPRVCIIMEVAALLVGIFELTGMGVSLTMSLMDLAGGNKLFLVLMAAFTALLLGAPLPSAGVYVITAIMVAPSLIKAGLAPIAAHFFGWYYGLAAALTPPVMITAFLAATIAGAPMMKTGWQACRLAIVMFIVPMMFAFSPELIMAGPPWLIVRAVVVAVIAIAFFSIALEGFLLTRTNWPQRIMFSVAGVVLIIPGWPAIIAGTSLGMIALLWHWLDARRAKAAPAISI